MWQDFQVLSDFVGQEFDQNLPNIELLQKVEQIQLKKCVQFVEEEKTKLNDQSTKKEDQ